jgi:hypothetical protein
VFVADGLRGHLGGPLQDQFRRTQKWDQAVAEEAHRRGFRRIGQELLAVLANVVTFLVAFVIGLRVVYDVVFSMLGTGNAGPRSLLSEHQAMVFSVSVVFVLFGGLSALWTRHVLNVSLTSAATFLLGMIVLTQAMYLADRGEPAIMWRYMKPQPSDYIESAVAAMSATLGWYALEQFRRPKNGRAEG